MTYLKKRLGLVMGVLATLFVAFTVNQQVVHAEKVTYSVAPIYPENQTDKNLGYYDLRVKPGQKEEVSVVVQNTGKKDLEVDVAPNTAITNQNGVINYSQSDPKYDKTLKYPFTKLMSPAQRLKVPAESSRTATFTLNAPKATFEGTILGGFYVSQVKQDQVEQALDHKKGTSLTNRYSYILGVKLTQSDQALKPHLRLNRIKPGLLNGHTAILSNIQNTQANSVGEMQVDAKIRRAGQRKVLYHSKQTDLQMAPNSNFDYGIDLKNQPLKAGRYNIKIKVNSNKGQWLLSKDFEITQKEARKYNGKAVELPQSNWWLYVIIGVMVLLILFLLFLLWRKNKQDKTEE
ncbi:DUF916 and DUF3324 domain-containing protein [Latilactobacillus sakei]|uniref:DUF916 and DUF3324 domain-containing protein n=1 Tax=Latilactobacillus sakei TaxID=1599 RepID=UPI002072A5BD|nr:DUF916 and DUF3324 domain-containing protein [Latilactobacillus sakei]USF97090.1 hypothetical protein A4W82_09880 [Latilactobacillus sakei]